MDPSTHPDNICDRQGWVLILDTGEEYPCMREQESRPVDDDENTSSPHGPSATH